MRETKRGTQTLPVVIGGTIIQTDPLKIRADGSVRTRYFFTEDRGPNGTIKRKYEFPSAGKVFEVGLDRSKEGVLRNVQINLGPDVKYSDPDDRVAVEVDIDTGIARSVTIYREEPVDLEALGLKKKSKSRRSRTRRKSPDKSEKEDSKENE
ncbi:hypothetical protein [Planctomycetes bacterium Pan216]